MITELLLEELIVIGIVWIETGVDISIEVTVTTDMSLFEGTDVVVQCISFIGSMFRLISAVDVSTRLLSFSSSITIILSGLSWLLLSSKLMLFFVSSNFILDFLFLFPYFPNPCN